MPHVKDSFGYNNKIERMGWFWNGRGWYSFTDRGLVYFRMNLKMKKPTLCCFTWIVFVELNFTIAFLLIRKTWDDWFDSKVGEDRGILVMRGMILKGGGGRGVDTPLWTNVSHILRWWWWRSPQLDPWWTISRLDILSLYSNENVFCELIFLQYFHAFMSGLLVSGF